MKNVFVLKIFLQIFILFLLITQICSAQGSWNKVGDMPESRYFHTVDKLAGKIYVVGGLNTELGIAPKTVLVYDSSSGVWTQIPFFNNKSIYIHSSSVVDKKLYIIGGFDSSNTSLSSVEMFDPNMGIWLSKSAMPTDRAGAACAAIGSNIYVIGGAHGSNGNYDLSGLTTLEVYNTINDTWMQLADMPTKRWGHSAVALNGKIYVIGGVSYVGSGITVYASVEVYDPMTNSWTTKSNMPTPRYDLTSCVLDSNIYAIGGWHNSDTPPIYNNVEVYNPVIDEWRTETPLPVARAGLVSIAFGGKINVYGGSRTNHPLIGTSDIYEFSSISGVKEVNDDVTEGFYLSQNYPNPFNPSTTIKYAITFESNVNIKFYNSLGQIVQVVNEAIKQPGNYEFKFNSSGLASGIYFYSLRAVSTNGKKDYSSVKKMILMK